MLNKEQYKLATEKLKAQMPAFSGYYDDAKYSLPVLVETIRAVMPVADVRKIFVDVKDPVSYASGFCALNSYVVYNLTGGDKYWEFYHISSKYGFDKNVCYLKNKKNGKFLYLGDIQNIPYNMGHPIDSKKFKCPNGELYTALIKQIANNKE